MCFALVFCICLHSNESGYKAGIYASGAILYLVWTNKTIQPVDMCFSWIVLFRTGFLASKGGGSEPSLLAVCG